MKKWLERKKAAFCVLAGICALSVFIILDSRENVKENKGCSYVVKIKHYGIDAEEMERSVTIPLEDALFSLPEVFSVFSSSENSLSSVFVLFKPGTANSSKRGYYEAVRDAAQRVYETLPPSAQRPEIISANNSRMSGSGMPVWSGVVLTENTNDHLEKTAQLLERTVKPRFESLDGTGEVIVSGVGNKQIFIILDQEKLSLIGLDAAAVSNYLGMNDSVFSGGSILRNNREIIVTVDGRYNGIKSLESALIPLGEGKYIELKDIAFITEREREPDILSRLNGKKTAGIAIMGKDGANLQKLSADINKELAALNLPGLEFIVLSDLGAEEAKAFKSILNAALSGAIMVALISFLLNANQKFSKNKYDSVLPGIFCAITIPAICLISAAVLSIVNISLERLMLAGIAAGIGTAVDAVIISSEKLRACRSYADAADALKKIAAPLTAGAATTASALLPLAGIADESVKTIAVSIAVVCVTALVISLTLLPPLLLWQDNTKLKEFGKEKLIDTHKNTLLKIKSSLLRRISRRIHRFLAVNSKICLRYPAIVLGAGLILTTAAVLAIFNKGVDTSSYGSEDSIYAQIEFDSGLLAEEADRLLASYSMLLSKKTGIKNVETGARTGSGSLLISFDPKITRSDIVRDLAKEINIPGGFIFFHENSSRERYWEIKIYGDEDQKCREIAEELAYISASSPITRDTVLNFKNGGKKMVLLPDRDIFAEAGISFSYAASQVRSGVYGPVAYKRIEENGEIDVRIITSPDIRQSREGTLNLLVSGSGNNALNIDTIMKKIEKSEPSSIRRDDRRRTASITVSTNPMDPRRVKKELMPVFEKIYLPPGYSVEFDPEAIRQAEALSATVLSLVLSILFCYLIIASINESFTIPLIVLAAIPPSLSFPALCLSLSGSVYNTAIACAFIAVSGMTVNAAVLCADELRQKINNKEEASSLKIYFSLRKKLPALLATTITTIAGAAPFLFLKEGANALIRTISIVGALGVAGSCVCSVTVIPSLFILSKIFTNYQRTRKRSAN